MGGRNESYWNAFLLLDILVKIYVNYFIVNVIPHYKLYL